MDQRTQKSLLREAFLLENIKLIIQWGGQRGYGILSPDFSEHPALPVRVS
jgi:hypothetical protein